MIIFEFSFKFSESWMSIDTRQIRDFFPPSRLSLILLCPFQGAQCVPFTSSECLSLLWHQQAAAAERRKKKRNIGRNTQQDKYPLASNYFMTACRLGPEVAGEKKNQTIKW
jgi:hypothetical protein